MRATAISLLLLAPLGALAQKAVSKDGSCGPKYTCQGSTFGNCCSQYGYCGSAKAYCGSGCNPAFGTCGSNSAVNSPSPIKSTPSSSVRPSSTPSTVRVTTNARCGPNFGTCAGSKWGDCCSQYGYCGSSVDYCKADSCNKEYGKCPGTQASSSGKPSSTPTSPKASSSTVASSSAASSSAASSSVASSSVVSSSVAPSSIIASTPSSVIPSSASSSTPTPSVCPYRTLTTARTFPYSGSNFVDGCPQSSGTCYQGYLSQCGCYVNPTDTISNKLLIALGDTISDPVACRAACEERTACVGYTYLTSDDVTKRICSLYSQLNSLSCARDGSGAVAAFYKLCNCK